MSISSRQQRRIVRRGFARQRSALPVFAAAAAGYAANCLLGTAVWLRLIDTSRSRWVHHALYVATIVLSAVAASSAWWGGSTRATRQATALLVPAAVPLAAIPYAGTHGRRHPLVALTAAPFLLAALVRAARTPSID